MVVSLNKGTPMMTLNTMIIIMGAPKSYLFLGNTHKQLLQNQHYFRVVTSKGLNTNKQVELFYIPPRSCACLLETVEDAPALEFTVHELKDLRPFRVIMHPITSHDLLQLEIENVATKTASAPDVREGPCVSSSHEKPPSP